jgi:hypothetical protein
LPTRRDRIRAGGAEAAGSEKEFANPIPLPGLDLADRADAEARPSG